MGQYWKVNGLQRYFLSGYSPHSGPEFATTWTNIGKLLGFSYIILSNVMGNSPHSGSKFATTCPNVGKVMGFKDIFYEM